MAIRYSDLDLDFRVNPSNGDVSKKYDEEAIKRSVRNLVLTHFYDRPFRSGIGSSVTKLLFEPINPFTRALIEKACTEVITNFEPRVSLISVRADVRPDENGYDLVIMFYVNSRPEPILTTIFLKQVR
jgi:phage baseplate assembly protein W